MNLPNEIDNKYLDKIRYERGYHPFTANFNKELNEKLYFEAQKAGARPDALGIIKLGEYFNLTFHKKLSEELQSHLKQINLSSEELRQLNIAHLNEQELAVRKKYEPLLADRDHTKAFDRHYDTFLREDMPDNPQSFVAFSETIPELGNLILRYLSAAPIQNSVAPLLPEKELLELFEKILQTTNRYHLMKTHYDGCLFHNGRIELIKPDELAFDLTANDLFLIENISSLIIENQHLKSIDKTRLLFDRTPLLRNAMHKGSSRRILDKLVISGGTIKYQLRQRAEKESMFTFLQEITLEDYYAFYFNEPLKGLQNITISKLLSMDSELSYFASMFYDNSLPSAEIDTRVSFKRTFLPKMRKSVLKSYLKSVTICSDSEIELYIRLTTLEGNGKLNLYATPLLKDCDNYYFSYFTASHRNSFYLVDYWLEAANESLTARGKALEKHLKSKIRLIEEREFNKFRLIEQTNFKKQNCKEEIDLLIQTSDTLIIGEVKCVKYPMYVRDKHEILNDTITKAVEQLDRKADFLINNQNSFEGVYIAKGKTIVKVVILNYPVYSGLDFKGVAVTDITNFISYLNADRMRIWSSGEHDVELLEEHFYYKSEDEFCANLFGYLVDCPVIKIAKEQLNVKKSSYKIEGLPKITFTDIVSINSENSMH